MQKISRTEQFIYLLFGSGLSSFTSFLVTVIISRKLSGFDFGTYRQLLLVCTLIVPIFSSAIPNSLLYFLPRFKEDEEKAVFVRRTILILAGLGILTSTIMILFSGQISRQFNNPSLQRYLLIGSLYPAFIIGTSYIIPFMIAVGRTKLSAIYSAITSIVSLILISAVAIKIGSVSSIVIVTILTSLLSYILALYLSNRHFKIIKKAVRQSVTVKEQFSYALPLGLAAAVSIWGLKIDQTIVSSYFDVSTYAIYSIGAMEFPLVGLISSSIYSVLFPEISRLMGEGRKDKVLELWKRTVEKSMLIIMPIFGAAMIISYPLITTLYTNRYEASVPIFQIYLFLIPIRTINFGLLLKAVGKTKYDLYGSIIFIVITTAIAISTIDVIGIYGPTISRVVSVYILAIYLLINVKREIGLAFSEVLNIRALLPIMLITISPIVLSGIIRSSLNFEDITKSVIALIVYTVFIFVAYRGSGKWSKLRLRETYQMMFSKNS